MSGSYNIAFSALPYALLVLRVGRVSAHIRSCEDASGTDAQRGTLRARVRFTSHCAGFALALFVRCQKCSRFQQCCSRSSLVHHG